MLDVTGHTNLQFYIICVVFNTRNLKFSFTGYAIFSRISLFYKISYK
jgi:hypothetical protein